MTHRRMSYAEEGELLARHLSTPRPFRNTQHEPPYPGDATVVFSMRAPGMTAHRATKLCSIEAPHAIAECGEWNA